MNYAEATEYSLTVKWKTTICPNGEDCWCRIIEPELEIKDDDGNEIYIAASGCIDKIHAERIVKVHNYYLNKIKEL